MTKAVLATLFLAFICSFHVVTSQTCASRDGTKCCTAVDHECFAGIDGDTGCFCDSWCKVNDDCCSDYDAVCGPTPCFGQFPNKLTLCITKKYCKGAFKPINKLSCPPVKDNACCDLSNPFGFF